MRVEIYVRPGASETIVGGEYDGALVVRVVEPAAAGRATSAALHAVADALAVPRRAITLVHGATSRRKLIEIDFGSGESDVVRKAMRRLIGGTGA
jgi:uncharacterized protein YggU (UPF0235/DUF167 family)